MGHETRTVERRNRGGNHHKQFGFNKTLDDEMSKRPRAEDVSKRCDNCGSLASDGGQGGFGKDGKYHTFCSSKCRSEYIQKGPKPLQVKLTMFFEQAER